MSFGFKYGRPNANYIFDVSFFKNPSREVSFDISAPATSAMVEFMRAQHQFHECISMFSGMIELLGKMDDGQVFAFGCSAGRHRSFIFVECLSLALNDIGIEHSVIHREWDQRGLPS